MELPDDPAIMCESNLSESLTDSGKFAYSCMCALCLHQLFDHDGLFKSQVVDSLITHLNQSEQVKSTVCAIADGHGTMEAEPFVAALENEVCVDYNNVVVVDDLIKLVLTKGYYDARLRVLVKHVAFLLRVTWSDVEDREQIILHRFTEVEHSPSAEEISEQKRKQRNTKIKRYVLIGLATVGGGSLIGLTGGLAAPLVAAGAGALIGATGAAALGTTVGVAVIGSLFGAAGAGLTGYKMKKRVGAIEQFEFMPIAESSQLHLTIAVAGWLTRDEGDFALPWRSLEHSKEQYCLKWEGKYLLQMGKALDTIASAVMSAAAQEALKYTVLSGLLAAIAWPASLIALASIIDNPWSVCLRRSQQVGEELANVLISRQQGRRPVSLIGFSLGARVIYYCLEELAKRNGCEGIIEDVYLFGTPVNADPKHWEVFSKVVAGKITNGYCRGDWLLKFLYRTSSAQRLIAGLHPVKWDDRRMCNIDLTDIVVGHMDYVEKMDEILKIVGIKTKEPPKRLTQLRLERSPSGHSVQSSSNNSIVSQTVSASPGRDAAPGLRDAALEEVDVATVQSSLRRLTVHCGTIDAEFAEDGSEYELATGNTIENVQEITPTDACEIKENIASGRSSRDTTTQGPTAKTLTVSANPDLVHPTRHVMIASQSRDSCLDDDGASVCTSASSRSAPVLRSTQQSGLESDADSVFVSEDGESYDA